MVREYIENDRECDTVFVELPRQAQKLCGALAHPQTKPPLSLMFEIGGGFSLLPLADYSPEYAAVLCAAKTGKRVVFIDDAYEAFAKTEAAQMQTENGGAADTDEGDAPTGETVFARDISCEMQAAAQARAENLFESAVEMRHGLGAEKIRDVLTEMGKAFALPLSDRERKMAQIVRATPFRRAYVVAGAAHAEAFAAALRTSGATPLETGQKEERDGGGDCWLVPYVTEQTKIRHYGFYKGLPYGGGEEAFAVRGMELLSQTAADVHKDFPYENVPLTDIIHALTHARLLSKFRGKDALGCDELQESALSVIAKGDENSVFYTYLLKKTDAVDGGAVCGGCDTPIEKDFKDNLQALRIRTEKGARTTLEIMNPSHRQKSVFLRRLDYLDIEFARLKSGADFVTGERNNLKREVWETENYRKAVAQVTALSHCSATVLGAAQKKLEDAIVGTAFSECDKMAEYFLTACFLELPTRAPYDALCESAYHACDFHKAVSTVARLDYLLKVQSALGIRTQIQTQNVIRSFYYKALRLVYPAPYGEPETYAEAVGTLYNVVSAASYLDASLLADTLSQTNFEHPCLCGAADGILIRCRGEREMQKLLNRISAQTDAAAFGYYMLGLSVTNRGLLTDSRVLEPAASFIASLPLELFLECAPCLRYGFSRLKNSERKKVAETIGALYGADGETADVETDLVLCEEYLDRQLQLYRLKF